MCFLFELNAQWSLLLLPAERSVGPVNCRRVKLSDRNKKTTVLLSNGRYTRILRTALQSKIIRTNVHYTDKLSKRHVSRKL